MSETAEPTVVVKKPVIRMYEGMFLLDAGRATSLEEATNHVKNLLARANAEVITLKRWDERKLAYEINGQKRGVYMLSYFRAEAGQVVSLERDAQLSDMVLRCLIIRRDRMTAEQAMAVKTFNEIREEEARREREQGASGGSTADLGFGEIPENLAEFDADR